MQPSLTSQTQGELDFFPLNIKSLSKLKNMLCDCRALLCDYTTGGLLFGIHSLYSPQIAQGKFATYISVRSEDGAGREFLLPLPYSTDAIDELYEYTK